MRHLTGQDAAIRFVVIDEQYAASHRRRLARRLNIVRDDGFERQREPERRAFARFALGADLAAHQLDEPAHDRKAEARAAEATRRRGVRLHERLEQLVERILRDADAACRALRSAPRARPFWRPTEQTSSTTSPLWVNLIALPTRLSRHCRMRCGSPSDALRHFRAHVDDQLQALRRRLERHDRSDVVDVRAQVEFQRFDVELAGFDLGEIENVVEDREQRICAGANRLGVVALCAIETGVEQQTGHADDAVHGRADFVAHGGEERALRAAGRFGLRVACTIASRAARSCSDVVESNPRAAAACRRSRVRRWRASAPTASRRLSCAVDTRRRMGRCDASDRSSPCRRGRRRRDE